MKSEQKEYTENSAQSKQVPVERLVRLREVVDAAIDAAKLKADGNNWGEAINWADLQCVTAEEIITDAGHRYNRVTIEEASPDCVILPKFIIEYLVENGFDRVVVATEW